MSETNGVPQIEPSSDIQNIEVADRKDIEQKSPVENQQKKDTRYQEIEEHRERQEIEDQEGIEEVREKLEQHVSMQASSHQGELEERDLDTIRGDYKERFARNGLRLSDKYSDEKTEEMGQSVKLGLSSQFPEYDIESRLEGVEKQTFIMEQSSFNEHIFRRLGLGRGLTNILKRIPFQGAGFSTGTVNYINGGLPKFLVKRTMYHEYLHTASMKGDHSRSFRETFGGRLDEGATEYYARQAASKEGILHNVMNPFYLPNALTFGLLSRAVGKEVVGGAYFNGEVQQLKDVLAQKWEPDAWERVYDYSNSLMGLKGLAYAVFKSLTSK